MWDQHWRGLSREAHWSRGQHELPGTLLCTWGCEGAVASSLGDKKTFGSLDEVILIQQFTEWLMCAGHSWSLRNCLYCQYRLRLGTEKSFDSLITAISRWFPAYGRPEIKDQEIKAMSLKQQVLFNCFLLLERSGASYRRVRLKGQCPFSFIIYRI